eukprot:31497-Pelagococcus_subviridis.AAC.81
MSTNTSDPITIALSFSIFRVSPPATDPAAVIRCATTKSRHTPRCTLSTMSILATLNSLSGSIRLNTCPLISPKLFEMSTSSIAFVCELIATDNVTAWSNMIIVCDTVADNARTTSTESCITAWTKSVMDALDAATLTTTYVLFCSASRTWQLNAQHSLSKHSRTLHAM